LSKRPRQPVALPAVPNFRFGSRVDGALARTF
jgi:hypothetical protein